MSAINWKFLPTLIAGSASNLAISAGDSFLTVVYKLQSQINAIKTAIFFTESLSNTGINATVPVSILAPNTAGTNLSVAVVPKGAGAFSLAIPDGTAIGGNVRGIYAVDLQLTRVDATQVASGNGAFSAGKQNSATNTGCIAIGVSNSATTAYSIAMGGTNTCSVGVGSMAIGQSNTSNGGNTNIAIGSANTATGLGASIALGDSNTAGGYGGVSIGSGNTASSSNLSTNYPVAIGSSNQATGIGSVAIGYLNQASGTYSTALGYQSSATQFGEVVISSGQFLVKGDTQGSQLPLAVAATAVSTNYVLTSDKQAAWTNNQLFVPINTLTSFEGIVIAKQKGSEGTANCQWSIQGSIIRGSSGSVALVGTPMVTLASGVVAPTGWTLSVVADTVNQSVSVVFNMGVVAMNVRAMCTIRSNKLTY